MNEKLEAAKQYLGSNWVLAKGSTYDPRRRIHSGMCATLHPTVLKAMTEGRL